MCGEMPDRAPTGRARVGSIVLHPVLAETGVVDSLSEYADRIAGDVRLTI
jgi:hypothetical protein